MKKKVIGIIHGVFDLFHIGHLNVIIRAAKMCDELVVCVSSDEKVFADKGRYPIIPIDERVKILKSLRYVDKVVIAKDFDLFKEQKKFGFSIVFKGSDYKGRPDRIKFEELLRKVGVKVVYFPYTKTTSSTKIRKYLEEDLSNKK